MFITKIGKFINRNLKKIGSLFLIITSACHILWCLNKAEVKELKNEEKNESLKTISIEIAKDNNGRLVIQDAANIDKVYDFMLSNVSFGTTSGPSSLSGFILIKKL